MIRTLTDRGWLYCRRGAQLSPYARGLEVVTGGGTIRAQVAFDNWTPSSAHAHFGADSPAALRRLMPAAKEWFFGPCGRSVAYGLVSASNPAALRLAQWIGFVVTHVTPSGWGPGVDLLHLELRKAAS